MRQVRPPTFSGATEEEESSFISAIRLTLVLCIRDRLVSLEFVSSLLCKFDRFFSSVWPDAIGARCPALPLVKMQLLAGNYGEEAQVTRLFRRPANRVSKLAEWRSGECLSIFGWLYIFSLV